MPSDKDLHTIHYQTNKVKAIETLLGILHGVIADKKLNELEITFLDLWLQENEFLRNDPDAIDILECIRTIKNSSQPAQSDIDDLRELISQILEFRKVEPAKSLLISQANILSGIIQGLIADNAIKDEEIHSLHKWLKQNSLEGWPASAIKARIENILEDGIISNEERADFIELLSRCGANQLTETGSAEITTITLGTTEPESITFENYSFCLTGKFVSGNRKICERLILERGGLVAPDITQKTHYLVLGTFPTRDWITSSYGQKIERALALQQSGFPIQLITEQTWQKFL